MVDKLYRRANLCLSFRLIVHFIVEIQRLSMPQEAKKVSEHTVVR